MNTRILLAFVASAGILGFNQVPGLAHGKAEHGGAFTEVQEYTFELVSKERENEKAEAKENEKEPHTEKMAFTIYVKDPSLKPVTAGEGTLKITDAKKHVVDAALKSSGASFVADADLPHDGKYNVSIAFTPQGKKPLKANLSIKVD